MTFYPEGSTEYEKKFHKSVISENLLPKPSAPKVNCMAKIPCVSSETLRGSNQVKKTINIPGDIKNNYKNLNNSN